jgi:hypothetical protein
MSRIRFASAREVYEAFPTAYEDIPTPPTDEPPLRFLRALVTSPGVNDAIPFCAYMLPRREAVWWASQCVRALIGAPTEADETALKAAEEWVYEPEEPRRREALTIARSHDQRAASTWVAYAAAWSSGTIIVSEHGGPPVTPQLTAKTATAAIRLALAYKADVAKEIARCIERGVSIAEA